MDTLYLNISMLKMKSESKLTVSTCWPVRLTELIVRQTSEGVVVLGKVSDKPIVRSPSITFVQHSLIMCGRIVGVPKQQ